MGCFKPPRGDLREWLLPKMLEGSRSCSCSPSCWSNSRPSYLRRLRPEQSLGSGAVSVLRRTSRIIWWDQNVGGREISFFFKWEWLGLGGVHRSILVPNLNNHHFAISRNMHWDFQQTIYLPISGNYTFPSLDFFILFLSLYSFSYEWNF